jgi:flagellar basal body-associated protein FliL
MEETKPLENESNQPSVDQPKEAEKPKKKHHRLRYVLIVIGVIIVAFAMAYFP